MEDVNLSGYARYSSEELKKIKILLEKKEGILYKDLSQIRSQIEIINQILEMMNIEEKTGFILPTKFFQIKNSDLSGEGSLRKFNWKSVAIKILKEYGGLMTTKMIYDKARILYPSELSNRSEAIRNFSSALYYLNKNGKVMRFKKDDSKEFIYGTLAQFELITGKPKFEFMLKFNNEKVG